MRKKPTIAVEADRHTGACTICQETSIVATLLLPRRQPVYLCLDHAKTLRRASHKALSQRLCWGQGPPIETVAELIEAITSPTGAPRALWDSRMNKVVSIHWLHTMPFRYLTSIVRNRMIHYRVPVQAKPLPPRNPRPKKGTK